MKSFDTIQQLWDYGLYCPICKGERDIEISSIDIDDNLFSTSFVKEVQTLKITCQYGRYSSIGDRAKEDGKIICVINCHDNTSTIESSYSDMEIRELCWYFTAECFHCGLSSCNSADIGPIENNKPIANIQIEREQFWLNDMLLTTYHNDPMMDIGIYPGKSGPGTKSIQLPVFELDFSDIPKLIEKIQILTLFS